MNALYTILLLILSNVFMTFAWYGHLKLQQNGTSTHWPLILVIAFSWLIAFFEYCCQVPANRIGFAGNGGHFSLVQLKVIQECVSLIVFTFLAYVAVADPSLIEQIAQKDMIKGITIACGGFYGPQGRCVRLIPQDPYVDVKVDSFVYHDEKFDEDLKICNFEMESSAVAGLAALLGHRAMTCCMVIADRYGKDTNTEYKANINDLIKLVLDRI